jgi:CDP-glucose 4,6-dehydratase
MSKSGVNLQNFAGVRVLITGHTGFKGAWLSRILHHAGAQVIGVALPAESGSLYERTEKLDFVEKKHIDINNRKKINRFITKTKPDVIIHMAAQPLVRLSYREPIETFGTNVMGTVHVLQAALESDSALGVVAVTTDKVYKNVEKSDGYREDEPLGGTDPYSASKSASEMVVTAWQNLATISGSKKIVAARSGNVIGGGDHAEDRLIPDLIRGFKKNEKVAIRNPHSLRPWQHVLDPLFGYLAIASKILTNEKLSSAYNFGPSDNSKLTVGQMSDLACQFWPINPGWFHRPTKDSLHESTLLWLSSDRARQELGWKNLLDAQESIKWSIEWELQADKTSPLEALDQQITKYQEMMR